VTKVGTGSITFSNANYTGATAVGLGNLDIAGGTFGSSTSPFDVEGNSGTAASAAATVSGGGMIASLVVLGPNANNFGALLTINGNASATFSTGVDIGTTNSTGGGLVVDTTGNVFLGAVVDTRDTGTGLDIQGGSVTATSVALTGDGGTHACDMTVSGGSLTIGNSGSSGAFEIASGGGLTENLTVSGGSLTYLGTDGLLLNIAAIPTAVSLTGGTTSLTGITLDNVNSATVESTLTVTTGATLYLGGVGLNVGSVPTVDSGASVTLGTAAIGALANWSSSVAMALESGSTATFQAADSLGNAHNISLSGALTGGGGLKKTGGGSLTLSNAGDSYTGATNVNAGTLIVSGGLTGTVSATVSSGANLEVDGAVNSSATTTLKGGTLEGTGSVGAITTTSGDGSTLAPGFSSAATPAAGALTANGNVTLDSSATFSLRLGVAVAGDNDQLNVPAFDTVALNSANLQLNTGTFVSQTIGFLYVLINGDAAGTGQITGEFAQGGSITASNGYMYNILYDVNANNTGVGNDVDLELVAAVPEPGTWAMLIAGLGMLIVWRRSRRNA
jgi:autotransporter-associated beta strand protein